MRIEHRVARYATFGPMPAPDCLMAQRVLSHGRSFAQQSPHVVLRHAWHHLRDVPSRQRLRDGQKASVRTEIEHVGVQAVGAAGILETLRAVLILPDDFGLAGLAARVVDRRYARLRDIAGVDGVDGVFSALPICQPRWDTAANPIIRTCSEPWSKEFVPFSMPERPQVC